MLNFLSRRVGSEGYAPGTRRCVDAGNAKAFPPSHLIVLPGGAMTAGPSFLSFGQPSLPANRDWEDQLPPG